MGLFDLVKCDYPLPIDVKNVEVFQTKDMGCLSNVWEIRADGTLHSQYWGYLATYTGTFRFYELTGEKQEYWTVFEVAFRDGKLQKIELLEHTPTENKFGRAQ